MMIRPESTWKKGHAKRPTATAKKIAAMTTESAVPHPLKLAVAFVRAARNRPIGCPRFADGNRLLEYGFQIR